MPDDVLDDPFLASDDDPQTSGMKALRQAYERIKREKAELEQSLPQQLQEAEQRGVATAQRRFQAEKQFGELGFPRFADLWTTKFPEGELTAEKATEFLTEMGVTPKPQEIGPTLTPEEQQAAQAFQQPVASTPSGQGLIDRKDYLEMLKDPSRRGEALKAVKEGRVRLNNPQAAQPGGLLIE